MLRYTGHPFVDVGVAAITAYAQKRDPRDVTNDDLERVSAFIESEYIQRPLKGHLTMAFTSNAWFIQDAFNPDRPELSPEQRDTRAATRNEWATRHVRQWSSHVASSEEICVFTGDPAILVALSGKLPEGRAGRAQFPLLQGDDAINFFANGVPGLPISGLAMLALQFFPMGCAKSGVGLLAVHSDNELLMLRVTRGFLEQNLSAVAKARAAGEDKLPSSSWVPKTLLIEALMDAQRERDRVERSDEAASLTAYNFNNGKSAQLDIYYLPHEIVGFLRIVNTTTYEKAWSEIARRGWARSTRKPKEEQSDSAPASEVRRNYLYDDLFTLPDEAPRFIRTYFLRTPRRSHVSDDPRHEYAVKKELDLVSWPLVELFLGKVIHMDEQRIARIRQLGDGLATYVRREGGRGKRFFRSFFVENRADTVRALLVRANLQHIKDRQQPLFDMDSYIEVFEEGEDVIRPDWRLARDLVYMRMVDQLRDWLAQNPDALPDQEIESNAVASAS